MPHIKVTGGHISLPDNSLNRKYHAQKVATILLSYKMLRHATQLHSFVKLAHLTSWKMHQTQPMKNIWEQLLCRSILSGLPVTWAADTTGRSVTSDVVRPLVTTYQWPDTVACLIHTSNDDFVMPLVGFPILVVASQEFSYFCMGPCDLFYTPI